jgi:hypothetical protein
MQKDIEKRMKKTERERRKLEEEEAKQAKKSVVLRVQKRVKLARDRSSEAFHKAFA